MDIRGYFDNRPGNIPLAGWQMKPELPTVSEIMGTDLSGQEFYLTTNQIYGPWSSTEQYLETHHNLLREDGVGLCHLSPISSGTNAPWRSYYHRHHTHTNHALDQLLTHIAEFEPNYIRLGGRSKNPRVSARTLFSRKESKPQSHLQNSLLSKARQNHSALVTDIIQNTLKGVYRQSADRSGVAFVLHGLLTEEQLSNLEVGSNQWKTYSTEKSSDPFLAWLGKQAQESKDLYPEEQYSAKVGDCDQDYEMLMELEAEQAPDADR